MTHPDTSSATMLTLKDLNTETPRWCAGCGNFEIFNALKHFFVDRQLKPASIVNISGIGCSGRMPNYLNTYGVHTIHGRAITVATGLSLTRPDLDIFIHSGDGDSLSIGGNHLLHGINKNFNCVFLMYDNEIYALTKNQTSPTTRKGHPTSTQPLGSILDPLNPLAIVLGLGASFVASTANWLPEHLTNTIKAAYDHPGFAFVHICQRCVHFDPGNFDLKSSDWYSFLKHQDGIPSDSRLAARTVSVEHDPRDIASAFKFAGDQHRYFGLFYQDKNKPRYDEDLRKTNSRTAKKDHGALFEPYLI